MKATEKNPTITKRKPTGRYASVEAFRQAKLQQALEATKHVDWNKLQIHIDK